MSDLDGLARLERVVADDAAMVAYPSTTWTRAATQDAADVSRDMGAHAVHQPRGADDAALAFADDVDVVIIGAGQAGLTTAAKLRREGVERVVLVDRAPAGFEGPWATWARMRTLRTAKELHGPDTGIPSATFHSWYRAQYGEPEWDHLDLIPREFWMAYLRWITRVFDLTVRSGTEVTDVVPTLGGLAVHLDDGVTRSSISARRVVVCTGTDGIGGPVLPEWTRTLAPELWRHSSHDLPLDRLSGARVAVLGAGASAFDNAATALEAGAQVTQFVRRDRLPTVNGLRSLENRGIFRHFDALPDADRLAIGRRTLSLSVPPPQHSVARCTDFETYDLRFGSAWESVHERGGRAVVTLTSGAEEEFDLLIAGTGFTVDLTRVPWLASLRDGIATWADRADLGSDPADARLGRYPYLGRGMTATPRTPESEGWAHRVHFLNQAALISAGPAAVGINALPAGSDHLVAELCRSLVAEDAERFTQGFLDDTVERVALTAV